ncbi:MAG: hypothetical protein L6R19_13905 [Alphaproteobacteria bacterium]|nr:hypothetical protein [Alphaproteobacteria bacterium]
MALRKAAPRTNIRQLPRRRPGPRAASAEWQTRVDLAACYRLVAHYGWTDQIYYLERACEAQIDALAGGGRLNMPSPEACEKTARLFERPNRPAITRDWPALLRMLDRRDDSYRS